MKPTMEILTKLQENSKKHHDEVFTRLYRYLLRPDIYSIAYQQDVYKRQVQIRRRGKEYFERPLRR